MIEILNSFLEADDFSVSDIFNISGSDIKFSRIKYNDVYFYKYENDNSFGIKYNPFLIMQSAFNSRFHKNEIKKYYYFFDKDEHFNAQIQGLNVFDFDYNDTIIKVLSKINESQKIYIYLQGYI